MCTLYSGIQSTGDFKFEIPRIRHKESVMVPNMSVYHCNDQTYRGQKITEDNWMGEEKRGEKRR